MITTTMALGDARFFSHEAMHTTFTLRFAGLSDAEARGVARECFELVDRLEDSLSRFREGGEVWRINQLRSGEVLYLSDPCHRCLLKSMEGYEATGGLFDVTIGRRIAHFKDGAPGPPPSITGSLVIHPDVPAVTCREEGREIDLGGIGKGFALDEMGVMLRDWDVSGVLISAGASSMLATGGFAWPVALAGDGGRCQIELANAGLSVSGVGIQGGHIIHPVYGSEVGSSRRIWVIAPDAASAEIWSTAMMLVPDRELVPWLAEGGEFSQVFVDGEGGIRMVFSD